MNLLETLDPSDSYFDAAQALYWYAADHHEGQSSELYSILSTLGYKPAQSERGPAEDSIARDVYDGLENGDLRPSVVQAFVEFGYAAAH